MPSEREPALMAIRSAANKFRASLAMVPDDAQQLSFQLNTFVQFCNKMQLPSLSQARKASASLAALADAMETAAPECMKHANLLKSLAEDSLGTTKADLEMKQQVERCVAYASSLEDCGRLTLESKSVGKLLSESEKCELNSGLSSPLEMIHGVLDCCSKIRGMPDPVIHSLAEVDEQLPEQAGSLKDDHSKLTAAAKTIDDCVSQVVAAAQILKLDKRQVNLAVAGVETVNKALEVLRELPRTVEPLVEKLDMVSEVTTIGARAARDLSQSIKSTVKAMHKESRSQKTARNVNKKLRRMCHGCQERRANINYAFAPCVVISLYMLALGGAVAGVVVFTVAMLKGFDDSMSTYGVGGIACFIVGAASCMLGVLSSIILRTMARVNLFDEDEEEKEIEANVKEIKRARKAETERRKRIQGHAEDSTPAAEPAAPPLAQPAGDLDTSARLIFGDSDKGLVAEMQAMGATVILAEDLAATGRGSSRGGPSKPWLPSGHLPAVKDSQLSASRTTNSQAVLQELFDEGHAGKASGTDSRSSFSSCRGANSHPLMKGLPSMPSQRSGPETSTQLGARRSTGGSFDTAVRPSGNSAATFAALMEAMGDDDHGQPGPPAGQGFSLGGGSPPEVQAARAPVGAEELTQYARYLGMDPVFDADLLWIAEQAYDAPLPANWVEAQDAEDSIYYYNSVTGVTTWCHPLEDHFRALVIQMKNDGRRSKAKGAVQRPTPPAGPRPPPAPFAGAGRRVADRHMLDDDTDRQSDTGGETDALGQSDATSLDMSLSNASTVRGKDRQWDPRRSSAEQPFIRSYGRSGDLQSSLSAARGALAAGGAGRPPLPPVSPSRQADTASTPIAAVPVVSHRRRGSSSSGGSRGAPSSHASSGWA